MRNGFFVAKNFLLRNFLRENEMKISMIGAGSWGTAMVRLLAARNDNVWLYARNPETARRMADVRENEAYLPGVKIPESVHITSDLEEAAAGAECVILCTPAGAAEKTAESIAPFLMPGVTVASASKGLANDAGQRITEVIGEKLAAKTNRIVVISGPNHAEEVGRGLPAATVAAGTEPEAVALIQDIFMGPVFRVYRSDDIVGVEYGGCLKNIIAIASGMLDGLGYGDNSRAALMTRGLAEMTRFGRHYGAKMSTFFGLSGMGDLVVTCISEHSRNRAAGIALTQGKNVSEITGGTKMVVEGIRTTKIVHDIAEKEGISMPVTNEVYHVILGEYSPKDAIVHLMNRAKKAETEEHLPGSDLNL
jgi:glycerol-3-phosphate dehydrogenase (NAD(P)+)